MLAVGAAAHGELWLLLFGLGLSIPILLFGSALISRILSRMPILMWVGIVILLHTAVHMFGDDPFVEDQLPHLGQLWIWAIAIVLSVGFYFWVRITTDRGVAPPETQPGQFSPPA